MPACGVERRPGHNLAASGVVALSLIAWSARHAESSTHRSIHELRRCCRVLTLQSSESAIDAAAVGHSQGQNHEFSVFDRVNHAILADADSLEIWKSNERADTEWTRSALTIRGPGPPHPQGQPWCGRRRDRPIAPTRFDRPHCRSSPRSVQRIRLARSQQRASDPAR